MNKEASQESAMNERHRKEVLEDAFSLLLGGKSSALSPGKAVLITEGREDLSINLELLTLFSPLIQSILSSLSRVSYQYDSSPMLILPPEISTDTVLKLNSLLMKGKAKFHNSLEAREVLVAAELLGINVKELHMENVEIMETHSPSMAGLGHNLTPSSLGLTSSVGGHPSPHYTGSMLSPCNRLKQSLEDVGVGLMSPLQDNDNIKDKSTSDVHMEPNVGEEEETNTAPEVDDDNQDELIRCICGFCHEEGVMIQCDKCRYLTLDTQ